MLHSCVLLGGSAESMNALTLSVNQNKLPYFTQPYLDISESESTPQNHYLSREET